MPERSDWESFFDVMEVIEGFGFGHRIANVVEFGCGYGTFTVPVAQAISGKLFVLEIDPAMVSHTNQRIAASDARNVVMMQGDFQSQVDIPDSSVDVVMLFNILHIESPKDLLLESKRVLKSNGRLAVIHWRSDIETPRGPSREIRPSREKCRQWAESAGFRFQNDLDFVRCPWHWGLIMVKPTEHEMET